MANVREIITQQIIEALEKGRIPWRQPWSSCVPRNVDGRPYSGVNRFLLSFLGYSDPRFITFKRCKELGGYVKQGEHGHIVCYYGRGKDKVIEKDDGTEETKSTRVLIYYRVWNVEQCEGLKLKPLDNTRTFNPIEKAEEIDSLYIDKPEILYGYSEAAYSVMLDQIYLPSREFFKGDVHYYATKWHEFGHSTRHETRLNRIREGDNGEEKYSREELVAEMTSAFLCAEAGIDSPELMENTESYINGWISKLKNDPSMITWASAKANQAADYIMGKHRNKPDSETEEAVNAEDNPVEEEAVPA